MMNKLESRIALLLNKKEPSVIKDYLDQVANQALLAYRDHLQWGNKEGESLYTHVLNGVMILETLREPLGLSDVEARVLLTAYTVHDINKVVEQGGAFNKVAVKENVAAEIERLGLPAFFPAWEAYLEDITSLVRGHGGSTHTSGELLIPKLAPRYGLGRDRVLALRHLMKAADIVDLSHTLPESSHKETFLGHLNTYLAESGSARQYQLMSHQLTEQRGLLSNVLHRVIADVLKEQYGLIPLLYYPDGIVYLVESGRPMTVTAEDRRRMGQQAAGTISGIIRGKFRTFIEPRPAGIKVDVKCLELGVPFAGRGSILEEIYNLVQRRKLDPVAIESKVRERAGRDFEKNRLNYPEAAGEVQAVLDTAAPFITANDNRLRVAELIRTYYIFLSDHFKPSIADGWERIYNLLDVPPERRAYYAYFEARYDRAYVLVGDLGLAEETVYERIAADGQALFGTDGLEDDPNAALLTEYIGRYTSFSLAGRPQTNFGDHLQQYVTAQHKQCVQCSSPFATDKWMAGDVREDITVQVFSNRLRAGPGEPKKHVCAICHLQFLLEKLNYPEIRGEKLLYLHLFPYSFLTGPFIEALQTTFQRIVEEGVSVNALNMDVPEAIGLLDSQTSTPQFRVQTSQGKPQPYGLYVPRYSETVGNILILPINAAGENDTERFLFALWNALVLQRHFGVKVLLSAAPVPPLNKEDFGDLFVDSIPLAVQGLLRANDYRQFKPGTGARVEDNLPQLWQQVRHLFQLRRLTFTSADNTARLVRALAAHPLMIFHETDRLLEAKLSKESGGLATWLFQEALASVVILAKYQGGSFMAKLSEALQELAQIAWQGNLRGISLERSSLLYPLDEVLQKTAKTQSNSPADLAALKAAAAQDIFDHRERLYDRDGRNFSRQRLRDACVAFVNGWFDGVVQGVYEGNTRKLLAEEKLLRSAFLFYVREQIGSKSSDN